MLFPSLICDNNHFNVTEAISLITGYKTSLPVCRKQSVCIKTSINNYIYRDLNITAKLFICVGMILCVFKYSTSGF